jgi:hypothetical protein
MEQRLAFKDFSEAMMIRWRPEIWCWPEFGKEVPTAKETKMTKMAMMRHGQKAMKQSREYPIH